jgi:hypothetical protein
MTTENLADNDSTGEVAANDSVATAVPGPESEASVRGGVLFGLIEKKLRDPSKRYAYVSPELMVRALRANPGVPLPRAIREYLCDLLEGKVVAPPGRPADTEKKASDYLEKTLLIPEAYRRHLSRLQKLRKELGRDGWRRHGEAEGWEGPPNMRAAQLTCEELKLSISPRTVQNIASKWKL